MPSLCVFELFKNPEVYFVNEPIEGFISLTTTNDKVIGGMTALLKGTGRVRHEGDTPSPEASDLTVYKGNEDYIGKAIGLESTRILPAGSYKYKIRFTLDQYCVTSSENERGQIRYELSLYISRLSGYDNVFKHAVTVINHVNLKIAPNFKEVVHVGVKGCVCSYETIFYTLTLPRSVFAAGQLIKYTLELNENSRKKVGRFIVRLLKEMSFIATSPISKTCTTFFCLASKSVRPETLSDHIVKDELLIPPTPPTTTSKIINIAYKLQIETVPPCCFRGNIYAEVPIIIAAAPLKEDALRYETHYPTKELKRPRCSETDKESAAVNFPSRHYREAHNSPLMSSTEQPSSSSASGVMKNQEGADVTIPHTSSTQQTLALAPLARKENEAADAIVPYQRPRIDSTSTSEDNPSSPVSGNKRKKKSDTANLPFMGYEEQPLTSRGRTQPAANLPAIGYEKLAVMSQNEAAALNSFFMGFENQPPAASSRAMNIEESQSLNRSQQIQKIEGPTAFKSPSNECEKPAAHPPPLTSFDEQPSTSREAQRKRAAADSPIILPFTVYNILSSITAKKMRCEESGAVFQLPEIDFEKEYELFYSGSLGKNDASLKKPKVGREKLSSSSRTYSTSMDCENPTKTASPLKKARTSSRKPESSEVIDLLTTYYMEQYLKVAALYPVKKPLPIADEEQPSTPRGAEENDAFKSPLEEHQTSSGSTKNEKSGIECSKIEIDTLRKSNTVILPPNDAYMQPTSYEMEHCAENPFIDPDLDEYDTLSDFQPLYPVYGSHPTGIEHIETEKQN